MYLVLSDAELQLLGMTLEEVQALNPGIKVVRRVPLPPVPAILAPRPPAAIVPVT